MKPLARHCSWALLFWLGLRVAAFGQQTSLAPAAAPSAAAAAPAATSASAPPAVGANSAIIPELHAGKEVYYNVRVIRVTPVMIMISHRDGFGSILLADLPPDLQKRFGYDPGKAAGEATRLQTELDVAKVKAGVAPGDKSAIALATEQIILRFGQPPKIFAQVNLRPRFEALGIDAKNQGARPSCAVFAAVSALEFQSAPKDGPAQRFSEEYLIWATLQTLGKTGLRLPAKNVPGYDVGFSMTEVVQALRAWGIALDSEVPYELNAGDPKAVQLSDDVIARAKKRNVVEGVYITGRDQASQIANIVQVINAGVPVIAGMNWLDEKDVPASGVLDAQAGNDKLRHVVLLVGYESRSDKIEDTIFLFKNSYGENWGDHGYGLVTYRYLNKNFGEAVFLGVH